MKAKEVLIVLLLALFVLGPVTVVLADDKPAVPTEPVEYLSVVQSGDSEIDGPVEFMAVEDPDDPVE
ncbi:MAG: hypothetical protein JXA82_03360 [Sedimentisphaerales bacterium]|nr:hypothetical protein [Sedimentisphaerales bacterium]